MKKYICLMSILAITACSQLSNIQQNTSNPVQQMKACLTREAMRQVQTGEAFAASVKVTAKTISASCINQLIPLGQQTSTIQADTQQQAQSILSTLLNQATSAASSVAF